MITWPRYRIKAVGTTTVRTGRYLIRLSQRFPKGSGPATTQITRAFPIMVTGKRSVIERAAITRRSVSKFEDSVHAEILVHVQENPIPLFVLIGVAAAGIGLAGWGASETLDSVSKLLDHPLLWTAVIVTGVYMLNRSGGLRGLKRSLSL